MADGLMGLNVVPAAWPLVFFTGISTGTYTMWFNPNPADTTIWSNAGTVTVTTNGTYNTFGFSSSVAVPVRDYVLTAGGNPNTSTIFDSFTYGFTAADPANPYLLTDPALTAVPANLMVSLSWTAPAVHAADPRAELIYAVRRGTVTPPTTVIASNLLVQNYDSMGLTNGTTYYHRIAADLRIVGSPVGMSVARLSNITATVPAVQPLVESWGAIAR